MKTAIFAVVALASALASSYAGLSYADVLGRWVGTRTEILNGKKVTGRQTQVFRRLGNGGFVGSGTTFFPGIGTIRGSGRYYAGGAYESEQYFRGLLIATATGRWRISGRSILVTGTAQDIGTGRSRLNATLRFVGRNRLVLLSSQSNTGRVSVTLRRR